MAPRKQRQEPLSPTKAEVKAKALKAKKAVLKLKHPHKEDLPITHLHRVQDPAAPEKALPKSTHPGETSLTTMHQVPLTAELAMKKTEDNTRELPVDAEANKHHIK
ncbi:60S ribosomal protein L23a-like [Mesocricetus auratus]|uniref:60S ribosomal protein L23a-like n=1 Tax=Mesocricetus auratus TaxID=10036 RepID=A0ABM2WJ18_MESAU|nr:60S ribosomal protein L23a-like [Mesocricetus auratus]